jgi:hypothetical protein
MAALKYDFPPIHKGDTWRGLTLNFSEAIASLKMQVVNAEGVTVKQFSSGSSGTTVLSASSIRIDAIAALPWPVGKHTYAIRVTTSAGITITIMEGAFTVSKTLIP